MNNGENKFPDNEQAKEPNVLPPTEVIQNPNQKANENIRVKTDEPGDSSIQNNQVGSEITDGEDA